MEQLDLFATGDLLPIREYLHVWSDAKRAALSKKPQSDRLGNSVEERGVTRQPLRGMSCGDNPNQRQDGGIRT
jgi:hypothetical protein